MLPSTKFLGPASLLGLAVVVMMLYAVSQKQWIQGCAPFGSFVKVDENLQADGKVKIPADVLSMMQRLDQNAQMCIYLGMFRQGWKYESYSSSEYGLDANNLPHYIFLVVAGAIISCVTCLIASIIAMFAICKNNGTEGGRKRSKLLVNVGIILFFVTAFFLFGAMIGFHQKSAGDAHDPIQFLATVGRSGESHALKIMNQLGIQMVGVKGRSKRDTQLQTEFQPLKDTLSPSYGWCVVLAWFACIFLVIAIILTCVARGKMKMQPVTNSTERM